MSKFNFEQAKNVLGKPAFEMEKIAIYKEDCLEGMKLLPSGIVNLTITSPPYNIGKEYEKLMDVNEYIIWCETWIKQIYRLTDSYGTFWLNLGYFELANKGLAVPIAYLLWDKTPFYFLQEVVWNYSAGVACKKRFSPRNEKLLWFVKDPNVYTFNLDDVRDPNVKYPNQKKKGKLKCNPLGKNPSDVWQIPKVTSGQNRSSSERTPHPAQFPVALVERVIRASSNIDDLILDPFIGSGSTAECALYNDRYVIGFEVEEKYINYAESRILNYLSKAEYQTQELLFS